MVTAAALLLPLCAPSGPAVAARRPDLFPWGGLFGENRPKPRRAVARVSIPLPKPRPAEAPVAEPEKSVADSPAPAPNPLPNVASPGPASPSAASPNVASPGAASQSAAPGAPADKPAEPAATPGPPPSACRLALTDAIAIAPSIPDIHGPGGCGGEDLVRLEAVVLPDKRLVALKPAAILRCAMASEISDWVRTDIAPLTTGLGSAISVLDNFDSFECRGRNRVVGAQLSEHGRANALDVRAFRLANGQSISLTDREVPREVRENVLHSVCARFTTVLGPGSDGYHEDHIHLDLMQRHNNYRICQWNVWDSMPRIAPLLPAPRPDEAPPREMAAESGQVKPGTPPSDTAKPDPPSAPAVPDAVKPAIKKRQ